MKNENNISPKFWYEIKNQGQASEIAIDKLLLINFLHQQGFYKYYIGTFITFVRVDKNIITEVSSEKIKDFVLKYVRELPNDILDFQSRANLERELIEKSYNLLSKNFFSLLKVFDGEIVSDTSDRSFFFFKNTIVKVTANDITEISYKEINGFVWESQIIPYDFKLDKSESDFKTFLINVSNKDRERFDALITSIGYLLHNYNNPSNTKAIIYCDEALDGISGRLEGRSGKSLVVKAISYLRKQTYFDGKNFKMGDRFAFQSVDKSTQIMNFNDVKSNFNFESLFSILTEGIVIEKKNKDAFNIPFAEMPKIVITTNFTVLGSGGSFSDRMFEVEFSNHYNSLHKPKDEFKKNFFFDWNDKEWNSFFNLMLTITRFYLVKGLMDYKKVNLAERKIIQEISIELFEFFEGLEVNKEYDKNNLFTDFQSNPMVKLDFRQRSFTERLKRYAEYKGHLINERKSNGLSYIELVKQ